MTVAVWVLFFYYADGTPSPQIFGHKTLADCEYSARDYRPGAYACVKVEVPKRKTNR